MRIANVDGRLSLVHNGGVIDVEKASDGRFRPDPQAVFDEWTEFVDWSAGLDPAGVELVPYSATQLGPPVPAPRQIFAVGLNYAAHADESGFVRPAAPVVFPKYLSSLSGPVSTVALPTDTVDWEVELVAVIGRRAHHVEEASAWDHVAGLTVGQDLSERVVQMAAGPHFSLGKSFPGFGPMGPWLVTTDELADRDDLELGCSVGDEEVQRSRTSDLVFAVPELVARLSAVLPLLPGDVIFTGTPSGVGMARQPARFLRPGEVVTSWVEGIGSIRNRMTAAG